MTIHYHGTPLTPRAELQKMAGKHFCVSYFRPDDAAWCLGHAQSIMWDNGAFSAHSKKQQVDWNKYYDWLEPKTGKSRLHHPHWAVIPDIIDGTIEDQRGLVAQWPHGQTFGAPVWHMGLDVSYLLDLANHWPRLCFGSTAAFWQVGSESWERRCDLAFNELDRRGLLKGLWVHMLRGLALAGDRWPFASLDSTNVATSFQGYGHTRETCPERMARRIDAIQNPSGWNYRPEQKELFA